MESLKKEYCNLEKHFDTWRLLSEKWLILLSLENYAEANLIKFQVDIADKEYKERFNQLLNKLKNAKDQQEVDEISTRIQNFIL